MADNTVQKNNLVKNILTDAEVSTLVKLTGVMPEEVSPLRPLGSGPVSAESDNLRQSGLLDSSGRPSAGCIEAFNILAAPDTEIDLLWGNPDGINLSKIYSAAGQEKLVSFTRSGNNNHLSYFLSSQDIIDLVIGRTALPDIKNEIDFSMENSESVLPVVLVMLDIYREAQLKSALERRTEINFSVTLEEITRIAEASKLEPDLNWYASAGFMLLPQRINISSAVADGFDILRREGVIGKDGNISTILTNFASRAFPLVSFLSVRAVTDKNSHLEKSQFILLRGLTTLILVEFFTENGVNKASINSISTSRLPELLYNLVTRPFEVKPEKTGVSSGTAANGGVACAKCNTINEPGMKFCVNCGGPMTVPAKPKFCPKCGDPVKETEIFCDKCGAKLS